MRQLSVFHPFVLPYVPGCTLPLADQAILSACIEFAADTQIIQKQSVDAVTLDVQDYDVEVPSQMALTSVLRVFFKNRRLAPVSLQNVDDGDAVRGLEFANAELPRQDPQLYFMRDANEAVISLYPVPAKTEANALTVRAAFEPTRNATSVEDVLFDSYAESIAHGAVARLLSMPGQPFTNPDMAMYCARQFSDAKGSAASQARSGQVAVSSRVRPVRFA